MPAIPIVNSVTRHASRQTLLRTYLSAVLLVGLGLNGVFGWSWADPIAALVIAAVAVKEGGVAWGHLLRTPAQQRFGTGRPDGCTDGCCTDQR